MKYKVGDEIVVIDSYKAGIDDFFQGKILRIIELDEQNKRVFVNSNEFDHPNYDGKWGNGYCNNVGISKATKLHKALK